MLKDQKKAEEQVLSALRQINRAISLYSNFVQKRHGITGPQLLVLTEVARFPDTSVGVLAENVSLSHATMTGIVDRLEQRGLVVRTPSPEDRRRRTVRVTDRGAEMLGKAPPLLQDHFIQEFRQLQEWEQTQILSTLQRVSAMMSADALPAAPVLMPGEGDAEEWTDIGILAGADTPT